MVHYRRKYLQARHNTTKDNVWKGKYAELKLGVKSLYFGHKVSSIEVVFDFPTEYSIDLEKELDKILKDKKVANVSTERSQKWIISQNCGMYQVYSKNLRIRT